MQVSKPQKSSKAMGFIAMRRGPHGKYCVVGCQSRGLRSPGRAGRDCGRERTGVPGYARLMNILVLAGKPRQLQKDQCSLLGYLG